VSPFPRSNEALPPSNWPDSGQHLTQHLAFAKTTRTAERAKSTNA
jgi:hypothetical protein